MRRTIAWVALTGGTVGFTLSAFDLIAAEEPKLVLLLSWAALVYEGFNSVQIAHDAKKGGDNGKGTERRDTEDSEG